MKSFDRDNVHDSNGIEMLRALADELEAERANVISVERGLWLEVCAALKKFD